MTTNTQRFFNKIFACDQACDWLGTRSQKAAWYDCTVGAWLFFIIDHLNYRSSLDDKYVTAAKNAINARGTSHTPAERIKAVVPYSAIAKAITEWRHRNEQRS